MWTAEVVLVCALSMLGRSVSSLPPIELVSTVPANVTATAEAYVRLYDRRIYLVTTSEAFRVARAALFRCGNTMAIRKIASVIIHEEVHLTQGADEKTAYQAQLTTLTALGAGPGTAAYQQVQHAMRYALKQQKERLARSAALLAATR